MPDQRRISYEDAFGSGAGSGAAISGTQGRGRAISYEEAFGGGGNQPASDHGWLANEALGVGAAAGETFGDMALGGQELIGHALKAAGFDSAGGWLIDDAQKGAKSLKSQAAPYRAAAPIGAFAGDVLGSAPVMSGVGALGLGRPIAEAALSGAVAGGLQPTQGGENFAVEKAKQAGFGAAGGAVAGVAGKALSGAIAPRLGPDAALLASRGVRMTPGQMAGGMAKRAEDSVASVPVAGSFIGAAQRESVHSFNRAVIDDALAPIGAKLPAGTEPGREAVRYADDAVSDAYNRVLPRLALRADAQFNSDIQTLRTMASNMPRDQADQYERILANHLFDRLAPTGTMLGGDLKIAESDLGRLASQYRGSALASERQLGDAIRETQEVLRDSLMRQNPKDAPELQKINAAFARLVRVEGAASNRSTSGGVFTPGDLLTAIKRGDTSSRKKAFATGGALGQDFAEAGQRVLPQKTPNSGTPERAMWAGLLGQGGMIEPKTAIALGLATAPYTGPALTAVNRLAQPAGPVRQGISNTAQALGALLAPAFGMDAQSVARMIDAHP
jgi:hypothetical protein